MLFLPGHLSRVAHSTLHSRHLTIWSHGVWRDSGRIFRGSTARSSRRPQTATFGWELRPVFFKFDGVQFVPWSCPVRRRRCRPPTIHQSAKRDGMEACGSERAPVWLILINHRLILYQKNEGWAIDGHLSKTETGKSGSRVFDQTTRHILFAKCSMPVFAAMESKDGVDIFGTGPIAQDPSGDLWVGRRAQLLSNGAPEHRKFTGQDALQSNEGNLGVRALLPAADGSLWVGMARGCPRCRIAAHGGWHLKTLSRSKPEWRNSGELTALCSRPSEQPVGRHDPGSLQNPWHGGRSL